MSSSDQHVIAVGGRTDAGAVAQAESESRMFFRGIAFAIKRLEAGQTPDAIRQDLLKRGLTEKVAGKVMYDAMVQVHGEGDAVPPQSRLSKLLAEALIGLVTAAAAFGLFTGAPQLIDSVAGWLGPWARIDVRLAVPVLGLLLAGLGFAIRIGAMVGVVVALIAYYAWRLA